MRIKRIAALLLMGVAFAGVTQAESCSDSVDNLNDVAGENDAKYAPKIAQVKIGMTKAQVVGIMGKPPRDQQKMESADSTSEYIYYGSYQLTFTDDKLDSKNKY